MIAALPAGESERLAALVSYRVLDTGPEPVFDDICDLAVTLCGTPISMVSLVDDDRLWFKSSVGITPKAVPRDVSFCSHAIAQDDLFQVADTLLDARFSDNPLVRAEPHLRFYAGAPLVTSKGHRLGTLCVLDRQPRHLDAAQQRSLLTLANQVMAQLELRRLLFEQRQVSAALGDALRSKDEFLAVLGHELRNPLAPISMSVEVLRRANSQDSRTRWATDIISRQVAQLTRLVDDLLDASRVTRDKITLDAIPVVLADAISQAVETSRPLFSSREQRLAVTLPAEKVMVDGDAGRLTQVFCNLLNNASKYTPAGGHIELVMRFESPGADGSRKGRAVVTVTDNGRGFDAADAERIFELFAQSDSSSSRAEGGLGIGLTLARKLVEIHGGSISATSRGPQNGSTFVTILPASLS